MELQSGAIELRLSRFGRVLRALGLRVGSGELLDAMMALSAIDPLRREHAKLALSATMAKDHKSRELFDVAFDHFFAANSGSPAAPDESAQGDKADDLASRGRSGQESGVAPLRLWDQPLRLSAEQARSWANLTPAQRERLREFLGSAAEGGLDDSYRPLVEHVIREHLERWQASLAPGAMLSRRTGDEALDEMVSGIIAGSGADSDPLLTSDMNSIPANEVAQAQQLIKRLAKRLATRIMRRYRVSRRQVRLDFRRTMRANIGYGGVPLRLRYVSPRADKPRILLLCDVSGSMKRYAAFTLYFAQGLGKVVQELQSFVFAEDLECITAQLRAGRDSPIALQRLAEGSLIWGRGTNLARALRQLLRRHRSALTPDTTVLILSDTKTLAVQEAADLILEMRVQVREILWLNTVPEEQWGTLPALELFRQHASMYPCSSLADLERVLHRAFGRRRQ